MQGTGIKGNGMTPTTAWGRTIGIVLAVGILLPAGPDARAGERVSARTLPAERPSLRQLLLSLQYGDAAARSEAITSLGKMGPAAVMAVPAVTKALKDKDENVRKSAAEALKKIQAKRPTTSGATWPGPVQLNITVGFSQIAPQSAWRIAQTESVKSEAKRRGAKLLFVATSRKQEDQIKRVRLLIAKGVDVIVLAPIVETRWTSVLKEARRAGIRVVILDRAIDVSDKSLYVTTIHSDYVEQGRLAARWLVENTSGQVKVFEMRGTPGSACAIDRKKGFEEVARDHPRIKIIKSREGNFQRTRGRDVMKGFLKTGTRFNALFAHNDEMALGAIQAMSRAGLKPGKDIKIVSIDAVRAAFEAIIAGKLNCTVECSPLIGPQLFDAIEAMLLDRGVPKRIAVKEGVFDRSTAEKAIADRQY